MTTKELSEKFMELKGEIVSEDSVFKAFFVIFRIILKEASEKTVAKKTVSDTIAAFNEAELSWQNFKKEIEEPYKKMAEKIEFNWLLETFCKDLWNELEKFKKERNEQILQARKEGRMRF